MIRDALQRVILWALGTPRASHRNPLWKAIGRLEETVGSQDLRDLTDRVAGLEIALRAKAEAAECSRRFDELRRTWGSLETRVQRHTERTQEPPTSIH